MTLLFALHDSDRETHRGMRRVRSRGEAQELNSRGFGIHMLFNEFKNDIRRKDNILRVRAWSVEIDDSTKEEQLARIEKGLTPTLVVESKRSFHVVWAARDATSENFDSIVAGRLIPFYGADRAAKDITRTIRAPGYYHTKNPADPFLVREVFARNVSYSEQEMMQFYPDQSTKPSFEADTREVTAQQVGNGRFWDRIWKLNCEEALYRLSGHQIVNGEIYTFRENSSAGTKTILVNSCSSGAWLDRDGKIGSFSGGGPSITRWIKWFDANAKDGEPRDWKTIYRVLWEIFPECRDNEVAKHD
jgi:hypothetical protein